MRILIADDDVLIRDGLKILLGIENEIEVVGTAANGQEAFDKCRELIPDIVLMDIRMPVMDGVLGTRLIKSSLPQVKVLILTTFKDDEYIKEAIKSGAEGYILKNQPAESIVECLKVVYKGNRVYEGEVAQAISQMLQEQQTKQVPLDDTVKKAISLLTQRELEIMALVGEGMTNKEIAEKLFLGEGTVRNYVTNLLEKLELRDRTQLAIFYLSYMK